ncbi:hypothetical protein [Amycolatopsis rubida]|uniref:Uncharacterized protein n=1 Tax=Amycolatopsis rubida TaxID=112413 RepID=A0A1I5SER0_9PSEU|nr:hypothetical protein [Amycolatopsis rubida]SFP69219.1 hypothetical protein SAMN05421854_106300 [Amycolatopsis rubida]
MTGPLAQARAVGDAVLYEGYLLYPYRASAGKNRIRWQWGVLMPSSFAARSDGEYATARTEFLFEPRSHAVLHFELRFLQHQKRLVLAGEEVVEAATVDGVGYTTWDEAVEREVRFVVPAAELLAQPVRLPFTVPGEQSSEEIGGGCALVRQSRELTGVLTANLTALAGPFGGARLRLELANTGTWDTDDTERADALAGALLAAHVIVSAADGHFLSMLDPPQWAAPAVESCVNERLWPVLVGGASRAEVVLASPIILYDDPAIAPESAGALFDGTEIDEILTLRTMALTEDEKRAARATDPRAAALVDRVDGLPPELLDRLHGTVRYLRSVTGEPEPDVPWWDPGADASVSPETDAVVVAGERVAAGSAVRLRPSLRGSDAQDMFLAGRVATVRAVLSDVDGTTHVAVTLDDDPAQDLQTAHGRFRYFSPDELEPLGATP